MIGGGREMNAIVVGLIGIVVMALGYRFYSKILANKIFRLDPSYVTPAHKYEDGVDYVTTNRFILWGHHFTSVARAAPMLGPVIGVYWGWIIAFLRVIIGTVFAGGAHDFVCVGLSFRNKVILVGTLA